jgi:hypothetical protein
MKKELSICRETPNGIHHTIPCQSDGEVLTADKSKYKSHNNLVGCLRVVKIEQGGCGD